MWTLIMILQEQELEDCAEAVFSSDHSWHRCGQSVVQATALLLAIYADCVLVNAHLAGPFVIKNFLL